MIVCTSWNTQPRLLNSNPHLFSLFVIINITAVCFLLQLPQYTTALNFNLTNITTNENNNVISVYGNATITSQGIQIITKTEPLQAGRAMYFQTFHLWDNASGNSSDFNTHFSFVIDSQGNKSYADGFTFFLTPNDSIESNIITGAVFGLPDNIPPYPQLSPFVAVEFDTYFNPEWDPANLTTQTHVGIDVNSVKSVASKSWYSDVPNGVENEAWISYNPSSKILNVIFTDHVNDSVSNTTRIQLSSFNYSVDLKENLPEWVAIGFSAATGQLVENHYVKSWQFNSSFMNWPEIPITPNGSNSSSSSTSPKIGLVVGLTVGLSVLVGVLGLVGLVLWKKKKSRAKQEEEEEEDPFAIGMSMENRLGRGPHKFSYDELSRATNNFSEEEKLGEGGFGGVYRGFLKGLNSYVAVKRISKGSKQGIKEYASEVMIINRLRHRNLVQLIGWCHEKRELLLVYDFMPNGSLDFHLFKEKGTLLTWAVRYNIAQGLASALLYLHEECEQYVVHRDIKSSNVMLDSNFNAKLGDFGLARLVDHEKGSQTTLPAGTRGYMAPEYIDTGRASKGSDVYSFGIVALEIACGRKSIDLKVEEPHTKIVDWVWELYGEEKLSEAVDPKLSMDFNQQEMECLLIVGLWCAHPDHNLRPSIRQAIHVMNFEAPLPSLPPKMPIATYSAFPDPALSTTTTTATTTSSSGFSNVGGGFVSENSQILSAPR